jgi:hypothetical protein
MGSSILSCQPAGPTTADESFLRRNFVLTDSQDGAPLHAIAIPLGWLPDPRLTPPRSRLERSDFVRWSFTRNHGAGCYVRITPDRVDLTYEMDCDRDGLGPSGGPRLLGSRAMHGWRYNFFLCLLYE